MNDADSLLWPHLVVVIVIESHGMRNYLTVPAGFACLASSSGMAASSMHSFINVPCTVILAAKPPPTFDQSKIVEEAVKKMNERIKE